MSAVGAFPQQSRRSFRTFLNDPNPIKVALYFKASDVPRLWDLASRHYPEDPDDAGWFATAARSAERGLPAVLEVGHKDQIQEVIAFFVRQGVEPPQMEELRV